MLVDAIGHAHVGQRVAALAQRDGLGHVVKARLHLYAPADAQAPLQRRQGVLGPQAEDVPGREAGIGLAAGARVHHVLGGVEGVARRHRPVRRDGAGGLGLEAAAADLAPGDRGAASARAHHRRVGLGAVLLLDLEQRQRHVERAVHQFTLDAGLGVGARDRIERLAVAIELVDLRHEYLRVTAIQRPLPVQVDDQAAIGRESGVGALARFGRFQPAPVHARAEHQRQRIGQREAAHAVHALLPVAIDARGLVGADVVVGHIARMPVEHVHRHVQLRAGDIGIQVLVRSPQ